MHRSGHRGQRVYLPARVEHRKTVWLFGPLLLASALLASTLLAVRTEAQAQATRPRRACYELVDLCAALQQPCGVLGVDAAGTVVGWSATAAGERRATSWSADGEARDLGLLQNGTYSFASAISDDGQWIAGSGGIRPLTDPQQFRDIEQGFAWTDGALEPVGALYNPATPNRRFGTSTAYAVNGSGQVVGFSIVLRQNLQSAFLWNAGVMQDIGLANETAQNSRAFDINDAGQVVGDIASGGVERGPTRAFLWEGGMLRELPHLAGYSYSSAVAIDDSGQVVGWSGNDSAMVAVRWVDEQPVSLGTLRGDESSQALALNARGQVVGWSGLGERTRAVLWNAGTPVDLNTLVPPRSSWSLLEAVDVNDDGVIVGAGTRRGEPRAFVLKPRPRVRACR